MLQKIELTACEKESFHVPSSIQMHGFLLAVQDDDFSIVQVSNNLEHFLKRDPYSLLGLNLQEIIGINNYDYLKEQLATQNFLHEINPLSVTFIIANQKQTFDVTLHHSEKILILEFEPVSLVTVNQAELFYQTSQKAVMRLQAAANLPDLFAKLTQEVKQLTGFDQVMLYQFANGYGKIIAEAKEPRFQSYYEYCYPINDIPLQALTMCIKNKLRIIPDVNYTPSVLISANYPIIETALDLSNAVLRGVSPTHIQDLKTMGVKASLTISIVTNNTLWGVIVCHHTQPKLIAYKIRSACELLSQVVSWQIAALQALVTNEELTARQQILNLIYESFRENVPWYESLLAQQTSLLNLIKAQGIALCHEGQCLLWGKTPSEQQVIKLFNYISLLTTEQVYENACISNTFPEAKDYKEWAAGMIASVLSPTDGDFIIWFRPGLLPTTTLERNPPLLRIIEQNSTDVSLSQPLAWQALTSYALPWSKAEIETVKQLTRFLTEMKLKHFDRTAYEYQIKKTVLIEERANKQQKFIETLCHEIRNPINGILGNVDSIKDQLTMMDSKIDNTYSLKEIKRNLTPCFTDLQNNLDNIRECANHQTIITDDVLNLAKLEQKKVVLENHPYELTTTIQTVINMFSASIKKKACSFS